MIRVIQSLLLQSWLQLRAVMSHQPVAGGAAPVVSLTSYGGRLLWVGAAIQSISRGEVKPSRLVLWISDDPTSISPLAKLFLMRLRRRGLEILRCEDLGPHKKWWPFTEMQAHGDTALADVVVADDDILYPRYWLKELWSSSRARPGCVIAHRTAKVAIRQDGIAPYLSWKHAPLGSTSLRLLATGSGGVLYPAPVLADIHRYGDGFRAQAPRADDLWLHWRLTNLGVETHQVRNSDRNDFRDIRGTGVRGLVSTNAGAGGNDEVIRRLYGRSEIDSLRRARLY